MKWAGGKTQLIDRLALPNEYNTYYEPFIGEAALLLHNCPKEAVIGDVNPQLINLYRQLAKDAKEVSERIKEYDSTECNAEIYKIRQSQYNEKISGNINDTECAALMVWLNKHCFNGLYRVNSKGLFNVPYNNKKTGQSVDHENLIEVGKYLKDIKICLSPFEETCKDVEESDFVYFDPPYIPEDNNFTAYSAKGFGMDEQKRLADVFKDFDKKGAYLLLSNSNTEDARKLYDEFKVLTVDVRRSINSNGASRVGSEIIVKTIRQEKRLYASFFLAFTPFSK